MSDEWDGFEEEAERPELQRGPRCSVTLMLNNLPEDKRLRVERILARRELTSRAVTDSLVKRLGDKAPSRYSIERHRRADCACDRAS